MRNILNIILNMIRKAHVSIFALMAIIHLLSTALYSYNISSHRPNYTLPATTLYYERFLLEFGYTYTGTRLENQQSIGDLRARIGILKNLETIFGLTSYRVEESQEEFIKGVGEGYFGFKIGIIKSPNNFVLWNPNLSIMAGAILPAGGSELREETVQPEIKGLISWPVMNNLSLEGNYNFAKLSDQDTKYNQTSFGVALKLNLWGSLDLSAEVYSFMPEERNGENTYYFNTGLAVYLTGSLRIDIHGGKRLTGEIDSYIAGGGIVSKVDIF